MRGGIVEQNDRFKKTIASKDKSNYKIVKDGQLVIAFPIDEGLVYTQNVAPEGIMSPAYMIWDVDYSLINRYFLVNYFHSSFAFSYYKAKMRSSTQRRRSMDKSDLLAMPIPVPPMAEQEAIVAELDEINEAIAEMQQQIADLDTLALSSFYDMFGDPITNPKGWDIKKLGEVCIIGTGATPSRTKENIYYNGNIPWVKTTEVHYEDILETEEKITQKAIEETNCKVYPSGTILMAMYGQGKTRGQIAKLKINATTNQACAAIQIKEDSIISSDFLYNSLWILYDNIRDMARGGNQANLNLNLVRSIPIILPPLTLQKEYDAKVEAIEAAKAELNAQIAEMQTLLASRMDYYFD